MSARSPFPTVPPPRFERRIGPLIVRLFPPDHPTAQYEVLATVLGAAAWLGLLALPLARYARFAGTCRFKDWTGLPCISCGTTRAVLELAGGHVAQAFRMNPAAALAVGLGLLYTPLAAILWLARLPRPRVSAASRAWALVVFVLTLVLLLAQWGFLIHDGR